MFPFCGCLFSTLRRVRTCTWTGHIAKPRSHQWHAGIRRIRKCRGCAVTAEPPSAAHRVSWRGTGQRSPARVPRT